MSEELHANKKTPEKRGYPASISDLVNGKKIRFNKDYKGNDQLGAIEVVSDSDSDSDKNSLLEKQKKKKVLIK
jgi:hypothetical protein